MRMILVMWFLLLGSIAQLQAQNYLIAPTVSYQYQKGSMLKAGISYATDFNSTAIIKLDATANFTWVQHQFAVIPEIAATYYKNMDYIGLFTRAEVTPYTLTPKVGISALTLVEIDFGYGFSIRNKTGYAPIRGFTTSLRFTFPLNTKL
ncbi:hypothetical protein H4K35_05430 [Myroides sp. NP-2]|uniref:hypothetical protein n=1 Tax=Myroides sp. NP-2 TaxID=2759945 RepID=UPI0015F7DF41|nr:hypothetical protein [Myroides sp. NP-2]MBB1149578.1 hypothetical protein [Myroides sp. NP-2]